MNKRHQALIYSYRRYTRYLRKCVDNFFEYFSFGSMKGGWLLFKDVHIDTGTSYVYKLHFIHIEELIIRKIRN